jgi:zinc protease
MKRALLLITGLLLLVVSAFASMPEGKIELDPTVVKGQLENGLTYYIKHHDNPAGRADFYIVHNVGSVQEDDNQDGLAHFLEHMAFNGTKHYPGKAALNFLADNGVKFGNNVNAYTNKTETVYNLSDIPLLRESFVDSVLLILYDWSSFISCEQADIEAERGVVREEWRRGDEPRRRTTTANGRFEYMNNKYFQRTILGNWDVVNNFKRQDLLDFYHKWYRPDLQAVVIVGDIDVADMEARVKRIFSSLPKAENPAQKEEYDIPHTTETVIGVVTDPDIKYVTGKIYYKQPYTPFDERQDLATIKYRLMRGLFTRMLGSRLSAADKKNDYIYKTATVVDTYLYALRYETMITVTATNDAVATGVEQVLTELRRVEENGFTEQEFDNSKPAYAKSKRLLAARPASAVKNEEYVTQYAENFLRGEAYMDALKFDSLKRALYESITLDDINGMIAPMMTDAERLIIWTANVNNTAALPSEEATRQILAKTDALSLPQIEQEAQNYDITPSDITYGTIVKTKQLPDGVEEWTLSNGVRVLWQHVDSLEGNVTMALTAHSPMGYALQSDVAAIKELTRYFNNSGIRDLSVEQLQNALVKYNFSLSKRVKSQSTTISGLSSAGEFDKMLQVLYLEIVEPNFTKANLDKYLSRDRESLAKERSQSELFKDEWQRALYGGHPWTVEPDVATIDRITPTSAKAMFDAQFGNARDFTYFITGVLPTDEVKESVTKYIASLPSLAKVSKPRKYPKYEKVAGTHELRGEENSATASVGKATVGSRYYGKAKYTLRNNMAMTYLRYIMSERYMNVIREAKGGTYYIGVAGELEPAQGGYVVDVDFETDPKLVDELLPEVKRGLETMAATGPTEEEMTKIRLYLLKRAGERAEATLRSVRYWDARLYNDYMYGVAPDDVDVAQIEAVRAEDVQALARKIAKGSVFTTVYVKK